MKPDLMNDVVIDCSLRLSKDVLLRCYNLKERKKLCHVVFHTNWVDSSRLIFTRKYLDRLDKRTPDDFSIIINFKQPATFVGGEANPLWSLVHAVSQRLCCFPYHSLFNISLSLSLSLSLFLSIASHAKLFESIGLSHLA
jgi:hypothetical protein